MITIVPADKDETLRRAQAAGVQAQSCLLYWDGKACLGCILYTVREGRLQVAALSDGDRVMQDALVRAALNAAEGQGAAEAVCREEKLAQRLCTLGFARDGKGAWTLIRDFFAHTGCCSHSS